MYFHRFDNGNLVLSQGFVRGRPRRHGFLLSSSETTFLLPPYSERSLPDPSPKNTPRFGIAFGCLQGHYWMFVDRCVAPAVRRPSKIGPETPHAEPSVFRLQLSKHRTCATRECAEPELSNKHEMHFQSYQFGAGLDSGMKELASAPHPLDMPLLGAETFRRSGECGSSVPRKQCVGGGQEFVQSEPDSAAFDCCQNMLARPSFGVRIGQIPT